MPHAKTQARRAALAAALATPLAFTTPAIAQTLQINGVIDVFAGQRQLSGAPRVRGLDSGGMTTSRWGLEGSEDLGHGLKASVVMSGFLRADTGESGRFGNVDAGWRRMAYVGLDSRDWGAVRLGRNATPTFGLAVRFNPFADSAVVAPYVLHMYPGGQPLAAPMSVPDSAADNSLAWLSPTWSGLSLSALYALGESTSSSQHRWALGASWTAGPLALAAAAEQSRVPAGLPAGVSRLANIQLGAAYTLPMARLFAQYASTDLDIATGTRGHRTWQLGASLSTGPGSVLLSWAATTRQEPATADARRQTLAAGYDHALSRRTDLYAVAMRDKVTARSHGTTAVVGIRHRF